MNDYLGTDILVHEKDFSALPAGDIEVCSGLACLLQDLVHRLGTPRGDLWLHPDYGLDIQRFVQLEALPVHITDLEQTIAEEIEKDPRVEPGTTKVKVLDWRLDYVRFRVSVKPVLATNPLNLVMGYDLSTLEAEVEGGL